MTQIVKRPFEEHLVQRDLPGLLMQRHPATRFGRQVAQVFDVTLALLLEVVEGILRIGVPVQVQIHLRIVRFERRPSLRQESVDPHRVAVALRVGEMRQDLGHRKAIRCRLPPRVVVRQFRHQAAENAGCGRQQVAARPSVLRPASYDALAAVDGTRTSTIPAGMNSICNGSENWCQPTASSHVRSSGGSHPRRTTDQLCGHRLMRVASANQLLTWLSTKEPLPSRRPPGRPIRGVQAGS